MYDFAFSLLLPDHDWFLQTSPEKFVNVSKIHDHFGRELCLIIPSFFFTYWLRHGELYLPEDKESCLPKSLEST